MEQEQPISNEEYLQRREEVLEAEEAIQAMIGVTIVKHQMLLEKKETEEKQKEKEVRRAMWWVLAAAYMGCVFGGIGCLTLTATTPAPISVEASDAGEVWADTELTDGGIPAVGRPMPDAPLKGQKTGACERDEVLLRGACWMEVVRKPEADRCGTKAYEHEGKCYIPVQKAKRPPTSVMP